MFPFQHKQRRIPKSSQRREKARWVIGWTSGWRARQTQLCSSCLSLRWSGGFTSVSSSDQTSSDSTSQTKHVQRQEEKQQKTDDDLDDSDTSNVSFIHQAAASGQRGETWESCCNRAESEAASSLLPPSLSLSLLLLPLSLLSHLQPLAPPQHSCLITKLLALNRFLDILFFCSSFLTPTLKLETTWRTMFPALVF